MRTTDIRRSAFAATSLLMVGGLALGACGGGGETNSKAEAAKKLNSALQATIQGDYQNAQGQFEDILKLDPTNKLANYNLGFIAQKSNRNNDAAKYYEAAIKTDPQFVAALYNLAIIETANKNSTKAIDLYKRALNVDPTYANAHLNLGFLLYETGDKAGADAEFRKALALDPALKQRIPANQQPA